MNTLVLKFVLREIIRQSMHITFTRVKYYTMLITVVSIMIYSNSPFIRDTLSYFSAFVSYVKSRIKKRIHHGSHRVYDANAEHAADIIMHRLYIERIMVASA